MSFVTSAFIFFIFLKQKLSYSNIFNIVEVKLTFDKLYMFKV